MKVAIIIFLNILLLQFCFSLPQNVEFQMITDVVTSYKQPNAVVAAVCRKPYIKRKLANIFAKNSVSIRFLRDNEIHVKTLLDNHLLFLVDANCSLSKRLFYQASTMKLFSKTYRWLVLGDATNTIMAGFKDLNVLVDSEFIVAAEGRNNNFMLHTMYKINPSTEWIWEFYGSWNIKDGLILYKDRAISNAMRRKDLRRNPIRASYIIRHNKTIGELDELRGDLLTDSMTKSSYNSNKHIFDFLNATKVMLYTDTWGYYLNDTWNGIVGDLHSDKSDFCGTVVLMNAERNEIVEYLTNPPSSTSTKIVFRQPPLSYENNLFVLPFTSGVWYCLGGFVVVLTLVLYINAKWDVKKYVDYDKATLNETVLPPNLSDVIILVISAISQQGSTNELKGSVGRVAMFMCFLAFVCLYISYSANIIVLLQSTSNQIRTVADLTNSKLEFGAEDTPYHRYYYSTNYPVDPVRKRFFDTKAAPKGSKVNFMSLDEGVKRVQTKPFAFALTTGSGYKVISLYFQEHEKCGLQEINYVPRNKPWMCSKKGSPYAEMFRLGFYRLEEHGLTDRIYRIVFAKKPTCAVSGGNFNSVNMVDFYPVLLFLLYGMILSFILLFFEIVVQSQLIKQHIPNTEDSKADHTTEFF